MLLLFVIIAGMLSPILADTVATWCGKPYEAGSPHITIPAASRFPYPATSSKPLLNFQCNPALRPYISGEDSIASIVVDADMTYNVGEEFTEGADPKEHIVVAIESEGKILAAGAVEAGSMGAEISFPLKLLGKSTTKPYEIECTARLGGTTYASNTSVYYLPPNPSSGTITKTDLRTGGLLVKPKGGSSYEPFLPFGFYTSTHNLTSQEDVDDIKAKGYNVIHPVPPFDNEIVQSNAFDYIDNAGLYLIYDMRHDYINLTSVQEQVLAVRNRTSLLAWYTADEPDGTEAALDAPRLAANLIRSIDPYHPVSIVLNCFDYHYEQYSARSDIIAQDAYPIGINTTYSFWGTECTTTYGDCGCDECTDDHGLLDIGRRVDVLRERARIQGLARSTSVWSVPQAFGPQLYWPRFPTGLEFVAESATSILHGSKGVVAWLFPNTDDIYISGGSFAKALTSITPIIQSSSASYTFSNNTGHTLEAGLWSTSFESVLMVTNIQNSSDTINISIDGKVREWKKIFESRSGSTVKQEKAQVSITLSGYNTMVFVAR